MPNRRCVARRAVAAALALAACADRRGDAGAQGAALRYLFREREHARVLVLWADAAEPGPVFAVLGPAAPGARGGRVDARSARAAAEPAGLPVALVTAADMARLFREHPDGWAAFYARYAGAPGLVEVGPVERLGVGRAAVTVGRSCGEHCRNAWRVELQAAPASPGASAPGARWRVARVRLVRVPE